MLQISCTEQWVHHIHTKQLGSYVVVELYKLPAVGFMIVTVVNEDTTPQMGSIPEYAT